MTFGQELVVLHKMPSMFGKFLVAVFFRRCQGLKDEYSIVAHLLIWACQEVLK